MSLGRDDIVNNISFETFLTKEKSKVFFEAFLQSVKLNVQNKKVKISSFGTFYKGTSPERIGRNPKTLEEFIIQKKDKIFFAPSNKIKSKLN